MAKDKSLVELWAKNNGAIILSKDAAYLKTDNNSYTIGYIENVGYSVTAVMATALDRSAIRQLKKRLKPYGKVYYDKKLKHLHLQYKVKQGSFDDITGHAVEQLDQALEDNFFKTAQYCGVCGEKDPDTIMEISENIASPVHQGCKVTQLEKQLAIIEKQKGKTHYFSGIIGGILGAIVGAIPGLFLLFYTHSYILYPFVLIPVMAMLGYRLFKGKQGLFMNIFVLVISALIAIISYTGYSQVGYYAYDYMVIKNAEQVITGSKSLESARKRYTDIDQYIDYYPVVMQAIRDAGNGDELTFDSFSKTLPMASTYETNYFAYLKNQVATPQWVELHKYNLILLGLLVLTGSIFSWGLLSPDDYSHREQYFRTQLNEAKSSLPKSISAKPLVPKEAVSAAHLFNGDTEFDGDTKTETTSYEDLFDEIIDGDTAQPQTAPSITTPFAATPVQTETIIRTEETKDTLASEPAPKRALDKKEESGQAPTAGITTPFATKSVPPKPDKAEFTATEVAEIDVPPIDKPPQTQEKSPAEQALEILASDIPSFETVESSEKSPSPIEKEKDDKELSPLEDAIAKLEKELQEGFDQHKTSTQKAEKDFDEIKPFSAPEPDFQPEDSFWKDIKPFSSETDFTENDDKSPPTKSIEEILAEFDSSLKDD